MRFCYVFDYRLHSQNRAEQIALESGTPANAFSAETMRSRLRVKVAQQPVGRSTSSRRRPGIVFFAFTNMGSSLE